MQNCASALPQPCLRVLVVDDDELDRFVIRRSFNALGLPTEIIEISDPRNAVDAIKRHRPDVTLLDIQMPNMTGFDVLAALNKAMQREGAEQKVMMLSSSPRQDDRQKALELGAAEYRIKPSTLHDYIRLADDIRATYLS